MSRHLLAAAAVLAAGLLSAPPRPASGCAAAPPPDGWVSVRDETALIVYDAATKTEHFIRTANFQTDSPAGFGFLVPTPSRPELAEASAEVFRELRDVTKPRTERRTRAKGLFEGFSCGGRSVQAPDLATGSPSVRVVEQKRVGDLLGTVLLASDAKALREWLTAHGYAVRPELEAWLANYTGGGWYVTAFQVATDAPKKGRDDVTTAAVRLTFRADKPFYPYREPADMRAKKDEWGRHLHLYLLSDERVSGNVGEAKAWPGETVWANAVPAERAAAVTEKGKLPAEVGARSWHLTEFTDDSNPRPGTDELYFAPAADQGNVEREPNVEYDTYDPWPWVFGSIAVLAAGLLALRVWRWKRTT